MGDSVSPMIQKCSPILFAGGHLRCVASCFRELVYKSRLYRLVFLHICADSVSVFLSGVFVGFYYIQSYAPDSELYAVDLCSWKKLLVIMPGRLTGVAHFT